MVPSSHKQLTFVLFEHNRNQWYNNQERNYHFELSIANFREGVKDTSFSLEKEITEYLEYQEHHKKLRTMDVKEQYLNLTQEKVREQLRKLVEDTQRLRCVSISGQPTPEECLHE